MQVSTENFLTQKNTKEKKRIYFSFRHEYHKVCIDPWLLEHRTCPMCKLDILKHYGFVVSANQTIIVSNYDPMILIPTENNPPAANSNSSNSTSTATTTTTTVNNPVADNNSFTVNHSTSVSIERVEPSSSSTIVPVNTTTSISTGTMTESRQITDV